MGQETQDTSPPVIGRSRVEGATGALVPFFPRSCFPVLFCSGIRRETNKKPGRFMEFASASRMARPRRGVHRFKEEPVPAPPGGPWRLAFDAAAIPGA